MAKEDNVLLVSKSFSLYYFFEVGLIDYGTTRPWWARTSQL